MKKNSILLRGVIGALMASTLTIILYILGFVNAGWANYLNYLLVFIYIFYFSLNIQNESRKKIIVFESKVSLLVAIFSAILYVIFVLIFPNIKIQALNLLQDELIVKGYSDQQIKTTISLSSGLFEILLLMGVLFFYFLSGFIGACVGAFLNMKVKIKNK